MQYWDRKNDGSSILLTINISELFLFDCDYSIFYYNTHSYFYNFQKLWSSLSFLSIFDQQNKNAKCCMGYYLSIFTFSFHQFVIRCHWDKRTYYCLFIFISWGISNLNCVYDKIPRDLHFIIFKENRSI